MYLVKNPKSFFFTLTEDVKQKRIHVGEVDGLNKHQKVDLVNTDKEEHQGHKEEINNDVQQSSLIRFLEKIEFNQQLTQKTLIDFIQTIQFRFQDLQDQIQDVSKRLQILEKPKPLQITANKVIEIEESVLTSDFAHAETYYPPFYLDLVCNQINFVE